MAPSKLQSSRTGYTFTPKRFVLKNGSRLKTLTKDVSISWMGPKLLGTTYRVTYWVGLHLVLKIKTKLRFDSCRLVQPIGLVGELPIKKFIWLSCIKLNRSILQIATIYMLYIFNHFSRLWVTALQILQLFLQISNNVTAKVNDFRRDEFTCHTVWAKKPDCF